jgi:Amt family ammonium transporter
VDKVIELSYALDTFYLLMSGALVMWMAAGFAMLEAGLVRSKNTTEILTKNVTLFAIACVMYMLFGYNVMYPGDAAVNSVWPGISFLLGDDNTAADVIKSNGDTVYSNMADFFFQVVFV